MAATPRNVAANPRLLVVGADLLLLRVGPHTRAPRGPNTQCTWACSLAPRLSVGMLWLLIQRQYLFKSWQDEGGMVGWTRGRV